MLSRLLAYLCIWLLLAASSSFAADGQAVPIAQAVPSVPTEPSANRPVADKWALIIGISKFTDPALNLKYPAKDASDFYSFLINVEKFSPDHVMLLTDEQATRENILDELGDKWLPRVAGRDDLVIIYISSHGSPSDLDVGGVNYIVAYDTDKNRLYSTGIAMQDLCRIIKSRVHTDRAIVLLDACHSGAAVPEGKGIVRTGNLDVDEVVQGTGQLVISSSEPSQISWESRNQPNSVFTRHLMDGLKCKGPSTTLDDAYEYMKDKVEDEVRRDRGVIQTPVLKGKWEGKNAVLAVVPTKPRPGLNVPLKPAAIEPVRNQPVATTQPSQPGVTTPQPPAPATLQPASGQAEPGKQPAADKPDDRIAVAEVTGPVKVDSDEDLLYKIRSGGKAAPKEEQFSGLADTLREKLCDKLARTFASKAVSMEEMLDAPAGRSSAAGSFFWKKLARAVGAKYLIYLTIDSVDFTGHGLTGEEYEMVISGRMVEADSGTVVWRMSGKSFGKRTLGEKRDPIDFFNEVMTDHVASSICDRIDKALNGNGKKTSR